MKRILELSYLKHILRCLYNDKLNFVGFILLFECLTCVTIVRLKILKFFKNEYD